MITCRDAQHLFDRFLDGELPPSLQTELNAHRLNCIECQNELAMAEAFGDVVALDKSEPTLGASFTDRVLLARRAQFRPRRRQWSRIVLLAGSPMAAAASIMLAFAVISPPQTHIAAYRVEAQVVAPQLVAAVPTTEAIPVAPAAGFIEDLLAPLVAQSRSTIEGTRRSAQELSYLLHLGLADTNEMLVAHWESAQRGVKSADVAPNQPIVDPEALDPVSPDPVQYNNNDSSTGSRPGRVLQPL